MLEFQRKIVDEVMEGDGSGICILGAGLGVLSVVAEVLHRHISPGTSAAAAQPRNPAAAEDEEIVVVDEDAEGGPRDAGPPFPAPDNDDTEGHMPVAGRIVDPPMPEPRAIVPVEPPLRKGVVMVLGASEAQRAAIARMLRARGLADAQLPVEVAAEVLAPRRVDLYMEPRRVIHVTTRILVVDLLRELADPRRVEGVVILNAHKVTEECGEAFAVRLLRAGNARLFVRAFTDSAVGVSSGFNRVERILRALLVRRVHVWPRFRSDVKDSLTAEPPVEELHQHVTPALHMIQEAILTVMDALLKELKRSNARIDCTELTAESGLFRSFDHTLRRQLDPFWTTLNRRTRQVASDLSTLSRLAQSLLKLDCVSFLRHLEAVRAGEGRRAAWLVHPAAGVIFEQAKRRVYLLSNPGAAAVAEQRQEDAAARAAGQAWGDAEAERGQGAALPPAAKRARVERKEMEILPVLEELPKWELLRYVLADLQERRRELFAAYREQELGRPLSAPERAALAVPAAFAPALVIARDWATSVQLQAAATEAGAQALLQGLFDEYLVTKLANGGGGGKAGGGGGGRGYRPNAYLGGGGQRYASGQGAGPGPGSGPVVGGRGGGRGRGRVRGGGPVAEPSAGGPPVSAGETGEMAALLRRAALLPVQRGRKKKEPTRGRGAGAAAVAAAGRGGRGRGRNGKAAEAAPPPAAEAAPEAADALPLDRLWLPPPKLLPGLGKEDQAENERRAKILSGVFFTAAEAAGQEGGALSRLEPLFIVLHDAEVATLRHVELYHATHPDLLSGCYLMFYEESLEERRYNLQVEREVKAFENLIRVRGTMAAPTELAPRAPNPTGGASIYQPGALEGGAILGGGGTPVTNALTRVAGGARMAGPRGKPEPVRLIVDIREFMAALPSVLHQAGLQVVPVTLEVGDYVLAPEVAVERKALADLIGSLNSGRLYHQATALCKHYELPVLLIEFEQEKSFGLQSQADIADDIDNYAPASKLTLLLMHFPKLRLVWSRGLHATADAFRALKKGRPEPDPQQAAAVGLPEDRLEELRLQQEQERKALAKLRGEAGEREDGGAEGTGGGSPSKGGMTASVSPNQAALEFLRRLPGVNDTNYRQLAAECASLADLASLSKARLERILGSQRNAKALREFLDAAVPALTGL